MRIVAGLAAFFLAGAVSAVAQYAPLPTTTLPDAAVSCTGPAQPVTPDGKTPSVPACKTTVVQGCPIDMRVRQRSGGAAISVDEYGIKRRVFAQKLRLILNGFRPEDGGRKAVSAMVTVHGTGTKTRMRPLGSGSDDDSMVKPFSVNLAHWDEPGFAGDFLLTGFTSASVVYLESVTYDDGSTWKFSRNDRCRVAPDPLMLIKQ